MQQHKIVARIVFLILSVINFALAAPLLVRVDVVDVAEGVTTALRKRWNPSDYSDKWWTGAGHAADKTKQNGSHRSNMGSRDSDLHPLPVDPPPPAHNNLPLTVDINPNASPQPSLESTDSDSSHPLPLGSDPESPPPPAHDNLPLNIDSNATPQPIQEPISGSDSGSHSTGSSIDDYDSASSSAHSSSSHSSGYEASSDSSSDVTMSPSAWYEMSVFEFPVSLSGSESSSNEPNPPFPHGNLNMNLNYPSSDPGPSRRPYPLQDPGSSTWVYHSQDPGPSTRPYPLSDPGPSTPRPPSSPGPLQHELENAFSGLFRGGFKRRTSGSRSLNVAQRELQGTLDCREYVCLLSPADPPTPSHKHPDFELLPSARPSTVVPKLLLTPLRPPQYVASSPVAQDHSSQSLQGQPKS